MDEADVAREAIDKDLAKRIKYVRSKVKKLDDVIYTECLNCFEPSNQRFCDADCRDDYEHRQQHQARRSR